MSEGYTINVPILINGGNGAPTVNTGLEDRELYIDTSTGVLYYGVTGKAPKVVSIGDVSAMISSYLASGNSRKVIDNFTLKKPSTDSILNSVSDLSGKPAGVYFVKQG